MLAALRHLKTALNEGLARWAAQFEAASSLHILTSTAPRAVATANALARAAGSPAPAHRSNLAPLSRGETARRP